MDEILYGMAPHSMEAEQSVIGSMLIDERCIPDVLQKVTADDFYHSLHRDLFKTISAMFDAGQIIDPITIRDKLISEDFSKQQASNYIAQLMEITPTAAHALAYAQIVRDKAILRVAQEAAREAVTLAATGGTLQEMQEVLQKAQDAAGERQTVEVINLCDATIAFYSELDKRYKAGGRQVGLPTGIDELDKMTGGLYQSNMIVLAARSGMGKSALALNIATETSKLTKKTVLFFSLEMNCIELTERVYATYADIDLSLLRSARLSEEQWSKLAKTAGTVTEFNVRIVEAPTLDMSAITRICRTVKPALVIIDHIGLVKPTGKHSSRREAMDAVSRSIKCLAKDLNIPVMALAQLNRAIMQRPNKTPMLSDLRESGAIEQDADTVMFVDRPAYYDGKKDKNEANLIIAKSRHGQTGTIPLLWYGSRQRFIGDWTKGLDNDTCEKFPENDTGLVNEELPL